MKKFALSIILTALSISAIAQHQVVLWTNQNLHGPIKVYYNDRYVGTITKYYDSAPAPGAAGCVTLTVKGQNNTWYGEAQDGTRWSSSKMTLHNGNYYTIRLYDPNPSSNHHTSSTTNNVFIYNGYHGGYYYDPEDELAATGAAMIVAATVAVFAGGATSTWDQYKERMDLDVYFGGKNGSVGIDLGYRTKSVFGLTAGIGVDLIEHYGRGSYDDFGFMERRLNSIRWNAGAQIWMFNGWNLEFGACNQYYSDIKDLRTSLYCTTNSEIHLFNGVGLYTGLGITMPLQNSLPVKFIWNLGLRFRLSAK